MKVIILDFETHGVHVYTIERTPSFDDQDIEDFLTEKGHSLSSCQWMSTDKELSIVFH